MNIPYRFVGRTNMIESKPINTPMDPRILFDQHKGGPLANPRQYRWLIGT